MVEPQGCINDMGQGKLIDKILFELRVLLMREKNELERTRLTIWSASVCQRWRTFLLPTLYSSLVFEFYDPRPPEPEPASDDDSSADSDEDPEERRYRRQERRRRRMLQRDNYVLAYQDHFKWRTNAGILVSSGRMDLTIELVMRGHYGYDFNQLAYLLPLTGANFVDWPNIETMRFVGHLSEGMNFVCPDDVQVFVDMVYDKMPNIKDIRYPNRIHNNKQFIFILLAMIYQYLPKLRSLGLDHVLPITYPLNYSPELTRVRIDPVFVKSYHNFPRIDPRPLRHVQIYGARSDFIWSYFQQQEENVIEFTNLETLRLTQAGSMWMSSEMPESTNMIQLSFPKIKEVHLNNILGVYHTILVPFIHSKLRKLYIEENSSHIVTIPPIIYQCTEELVLQISDVRYNYRDDYEGGLDEMYLHPANIKKLTVNYSLKPENFTWISVEHLRIDLLVVDFDMPERLMQVMPKLKCMLINFPHYTHEEKDAERPEFKLDRSILEKTKLQYIGLHNLRLQKTEIDYVKGFLKRYPQLCDIQLLSNMVPVIREFVEEENIDIIVGEFPPPKKPSYH
ncbi:hypothetical protein EC988_000858 [Linderina pennispora]|nr:hypothetical protein EC988_000858 [Linderina pennispora]